MTQKEPPCVKNKTKLNVQRNLSLINVMQLPGQQRSSGHCAKHIHRVVYTNLSVSPCRTGWISQCKHRKRQKETAHQFLLREGISNRIPGTFEQQPKWLLGQTGVFRWCSTDHFLHKWGDLHSINRVIFTMHVPCGIIVTQYNAVSVCNPCNSQSTGIAITCHSCTQFIISSEIKCKTAMSTWNGAIVI